MSYIFINIWLIFSTKTLFNVIYLYNHSTDFFLLFMKKVFSLLWIQLSVTTSTLRLDQKCWPSILGTNKKCLMVFSLCRGVSQVCNKYDLILPQSLLIKRTQLISITIFCMSHPWVNIFPVVTNIIFMYVWISIGVQKILSDIYNADIILMTNKNK